MGRRRRPDSKWTAPAENGDGKTSKKGEVTNVYTPLSASVPPLVPSATKGEKHRQNVEAEKKRGKANGNVPDSQILIVRVIRRENQLS
jgi:hypothetical protein